MQSLKYFGLCYVVWKVKIVEGGEVSELNCSSASREKMLVESIRRMADYPNPVELVNNMYGCHPEDGGGRGEYLVNIYRGLEAS